MTPLTVTVDQLIGWSVAGYAFLHVMFGLVTHYHSVLEVRRFNKNERYNRIGAFKMLTLFAGRMGFGFPWFVISRSVAPIGNKWHWSAEDIQKWG